MSTLKVKVIVWLQGQKISETAKTIRLKLISTYKKWGEKFSFINWTLIITII